jgi:hypothetical protein
MSVGREKTKVDITADYDARKNQTTISTRSEGNDEGDDKGNKKITEPGLVLLMLGTNSGKLVIAYTPGT